MSNDVNWLVDTMRARERGYWTLAQHPKLLTQLFGDFSRPGTPLEPSAKRLLDRQAQMLPTDRFEALFSSKLAKPRNFSELAAWTIFWAFAHGCDSITQLAHIDDQEPELNGALIKAIEEGCRRFRSPVSSRSQANCIAVGFLNLAKLGNESRTGADFGIAIEVESGARKSFVVSHVQAKRARNLEVDVDRAAGDSTQLQHLVSRYSGRYLFYNQHGSPEGLFPSTMSAELVNELSLKGTRKIDPLELADDFSVSVAAAVGYAADFGLRPPNASIPRRLGYDFADSLDGAVSLLFPADADGLKISKLLVARVSEQRYTPYDVAKLDHTWQQAVRRRLSGLQTTKWMATHHQDQDEQLPPLTGY